MDRLLQTSASSGSKPTLDRIEVGNHLLFWLSLFVLLVWLDPKESGLLFAVGKELLQIGFFAIIVYTNRFYFFPRYLATRNAWTHLLFLTAFALLITPIRILVFYFVYSQQPDIQPYFIDNQFNIFLSCLFVGIVSTMFSIMRDWVNNQRVRQEIQNRSLVTELNFLKSQINPHFLFNTLNNLYALTLKKSDEAPEIVLKLSEMMRYMLYECNEPVVLLSKEISYLASYIELEKLRQGSRFDIRLSVSGEITDQTIAPLLFIPFVENCFKHGVNQQLKDGFVHIDIKVDTDAVSLQVANSKADMDKTKQKSISGGIGLTNVKRRLNLLYANQYQLNIADEKNTYKVDLNLKLAKQAAT